MDNYDLTTISIAKRALEYYRKGLPMRTIMDDDDLADILDLLLRKIADDS
jgi:hypothetical protein